jgi:hypothetical protein
MAIERERVTPTASQPDLPGNTAPTPDPDPGINPDKDRVIAHLRVVFAALAEHSPNK